jgi:Spy/CpxP family protein refolding chaperone
MSTASTTQQHHLSRPAALAAAATIAVVGGITALGVTLQHDSSAPSPPASQVRTSTWQGCTDPRCLTPQQRSDIKNHEQNAPKAVTHPRSIQPPGGMAQ